MSEELGYTELAARYKAALEAIVAACVQNAPKEALMAIARNVLNGWKE